MQFIDQACHIQVRPREAIAITIHHGLRNTFHTNRRPQRRSDQVLGNGNLFDDGTKLGECLCRFSDFGIGRGFGFRTIKAFFDDADAQTFYTSGMRLEPP